jgi:hypothetical protein
MNTLMDRRTTVEGERSSALPIIDLAGIFGLAGVIAIHTSELSGKVEETNYLGFGYLLLVAASVVSIVLIAQRDLRGWMLGGVTCAATLVGYVLTRTTGLPNAMGDKGNWSEPVAVWSMIAEIAVVVLAVMVVRARQGVQR